jgi:predicted nucleic acid-binding protein
MVEFSSLEIMDLRKKLYTEVQHPQPEAKDFERVKPKIVSHIAQTIWEKLNRPRNRDMDIWLEAEDIWNFIRFSW